jgi:hypothetical protein
MPPTWLELSAVDGTRVCFGPGALVSLDRPGQLDNRGRCPGDYRLRPVYLQVYPNIVALIRSRQKDLAVSVGSGDARVEPQIDFGLSAGLNIGGGCRVRITTRQRQEQMAVDTEHFETNGQRPLADVDGATTKWSPLRRGVKIVTRCLPSSP